jgi:hypothetical protein
VQEAYRTLHYQDQKRNSTKYIIIKTLNIQNKGRILKATKEKKQITYKGKPITILADFSTKTLNTRSTWQYIFQALNKTAVNLN